MFVLLSKRLYQLRCKVINNSRKPTFMKHKLLILFAQLLILLI